MPHVESSRTEKKTSGPVGDREIVVTRDFAAPRPLVYAAFTDPKHVPKWWGPKGFVVTTKDIDVRVGGRWRFDMKGPDGTVFPNRIDYTALRAPSHIAYAHGADVDPDPARFTVAIDLEELGPARTRVTMHSTFDTAARRDAVVGFGAVELGQSTLEKGEQHVARSLFVTPHATAPRATLRRLLHAPRALVWEAMTKPEHFARWYGPRVTKVTEVSLDLRVGGAWRVVMTSPDGSAHTFSGVYREIVPGERIVQTWAWGGAPGASSVETMELVDLGELTLVEATVEHASRQALEMHLAHGMEEGATETYERLDELLATMRAAS